MRAPRDCFGAWGPSSSAMYASEFTLEGVCLEALWLAALFTLDQCRANRFDLCAALLLTPNEITDVFAIVGVVAAFDLRLDPVILLVGQRNRRADSHHGEPSDMTRTYHWCWPCDTARQTDPQTCAPQPRKTPQNAELGQSQLVDFGGERGTRTLDLGIMSSDFKQKSLLTQSLSDVLFGSAPVFVRIFPGNFSCVRTKSDTVMGFTAEALQRNRRKSRGQDEAVRFAILGRARAHFR